MPRNFCGRTRREFLWQTGAGFGGLALTDLLSRDGFFGQANASEDRKLPAPHFAPKAKSVIFLFMYGGPSHIDTFDYKPTMKGRDNQVVTVKTFGRGGHKNQGRIVEPRWSFKQYGESGAWVSDLFPNVAKHVDRLTFIKSLHGSNEAHGGALLKIHTGSDTFVRPSLGAWISYGLGTQNANLPSFVTINPTLGHGGVRNFGSAFLPPNHQGTRIAVSGKEAKLENLVPRHGDPLQRLELDYVRDMERVGVAGSMLEAIEAKEKTFELAYRMQSEALGRFQLESETAETQKLYGIDGGPSDGFGRQCLLARRLSEAGVRFVQVSHAYWDQHSELKEKHAELAGQVDVPIAGLIEDLQRRGLFSETLLIWGGEFGRTPTAQGDNGRDHNPHAFTWWMCGPGIKPGLTWGASDDFGFYAQQDKVHVHDLHATLLHLLGIDHERLTFRYGGRDFRLTDVHGRVVRELFA